MTASTPTQRTDALIALHESRRAVYFPLRLDETINFARQLERDLAAAEAALKVARETALEEAAEVCDSRLQSAGNYSGTPDEIRDREAADIAIEIRTLKNAAAMPQAAESVSLGANRRVQPPREGEPLSKNVGLLEPAAAAPDALSRSGPSADEIRRVLALGYCSPENARKAFDDDLIDAMVKEVMRLLDAAIKGGGK